MNSIRSIAIVATDPPARREATMPAAISIWLSTQPPKIWPLALISLGPGTTRSTGFLWSIVMFFLLRVIGGVGVLPHPAAQEHQAHQRDAEQHGQAHAERGSNQHVDMDHLVASRDKHDCDRGDG